MFDELTVKSLLKKIRTHETGASTLLGVGILGLSLYLGLQFSRTFGEKIIDIYRGMQTSAPLAIVQSLPPSPNFRLLPLKYIVQKGDSTWKIAEAFYGSGYNYVDVEKENNLVKDQQLEENTVLVIPFADPKPVPEDNVRATMHRTTASDTLWKLAQRYYGDGYRWTVIYEANKPKIPNPDRLDKGLDLVIPK